VVNALPKTLVARVRGRIARSREILAITGAGVSAESGIPTFRTDGGLWQQDDLRRLATRAGFADDPEGVWRWYDDRRRQIAGARPNPAHLALARLEQQDKRVVIVTQNVDDLHERAGSTDVIHVHGSRRIAKSRWPRYHRSAPAAVSSGPTSSGSGKPCLPGRSIR
jgi:NAD-dependent deacetylase